VTRHYTKLTLKILSEYLHLDDNGDWYWLQHQGRQRAGAKAGSRRANGQYVIRIFSKAYTPQRLQYFLEHNGKWPKRPVRRNRADISNMTDLEICNSLSDAIDRDEAAHRPLRPCPISALNM
jgi:hypothetical protein